MISLPTPPSRYQSPSTTFSSPRLMPTSVRQHTTPVSVKQIIITPKHSVGYESRANKTPDTHFKKLAHQPILVPTQTHRTNPIVWCCAVVCLIFSLLLIFFGITTLILFLVVRPKTPAFNTPNAHLSTIYFDAPEYFNGDFTLLANFTNPNRRLDIRFEYLAIELYFADRLIAAQALQSFTERPRETRLETVHMISSLVYLPENHAVALRRQVMSNKVNYNIRATFKVRASLGLLHVSYWLHSRCQLQMTGPPTGILVAQNCQTKR